MTSNLNCILSLGCLSHRCSRSWLIPVRVVPLLLSHTSIIYWKSKCQIYQWRVMDFLNAYSRNLRCIVQARYSHLKQPQQLQGLSRRFQKANLVIYRRLKIPYTITGIKSPSYIIESIAQWSQFRACNPEVDSSSLPRLPSFDLKKLK